MAVVKAKPKKVVVKAKPKPLTIRQQAINQVNAVNKAATQAVETAATKATDTARRQGEQAIGFEHALADITQGDAGRIQDVFANAANKISAYGDLALASAGDSSRSAAQQAQNYLASVGPDVGAETRPDIAGALRALGATGVGDPAGLLRTQGAFAQERATNIRQAQLNRLTDIANNAIYQGTQTANQLREAEVNRQAASRTADVNAAVTTLKEQARLTDDQRMKDLAFKIELQQKKVDLAAARLANATGQIAKKKAQKELDNYQAQLDASLAQTRAETANTIAQTQATKTDTANAKKTGGKGLTAFQQSQRWKDAHDAAALMYDPPKPKGAGAFDKAPPRMGYQQALKRLTGKFGLTKAQGVQILDAYYDTPGEDGRPVFSFTERAQLRKLGFKPAQISAAAAGYQKAKQTRKTNAGYKLWLKMTDRL